MPSIVEQHKEFLRNHSFDKHKYFCGFTHSESIILEKFGFWLEALVLGLIAPFTEKQMNFMITQPSQALANVYFLVGGREYQQVSLGQAKVCGVLPISTWRSYCCRSKINLNITKGIDAQMYATSSSRPFELASSGCCVVSDPYSGLEEWFDVGKEIFVVHSAEEAIETYKMLLSSEALRRETGQLARKRVLKEHTTQHRAKQLTVYIDYIKRQGLP